MKRLHGGASDPSLLDFSANVNPLGVPDKVRAVLADAASRVDRYPTPDAREFAAAIARHYGIPTSCVLPGNGASDLIYLVARLFAGRSGRARSSRDRCPAGSAGQPGRCHPTESHTQRGSG